jgi:D-alanine transaminase
MSDEILYLNGQFMPLSEGRVNVEDRGFQLGDGIYEVVKVLNGHPMWLEDHLTRLRASLKAIRLVDTLAAHPLEEVVPELIRQSGLGNATVYIQVTRGYAPREFIFPHPPEPTILAYVRAKEFPTADEIMRGTTLHPVRDQRWAHCDIKSTNLLAAVLAKEEAFEAGADEALFVSQRGVVREGGSSNVFAVVEGVIRTHPLSNRILGGITRKHAIAAAHRIGLSVEERAFTLPEITDPEGGCSEVFTASTAKDLLPVRQIGEAVIHGGRPGDITLELLDIMRAEQAFMAEMELPIELSSLSRG